MSVFHKKINTIHNTAPFTQIKTEDYIPAFQKAIDDTKAEINLIVANTDEPTFKNTLEALAFTGMELDILSNIFFNLNSAETNDEMQKIAQEIAPMLSALSNDILLNEDLFLRVKKVYNQKESLNLTPEQETLLTKNYKSFVRNGALLAEDKKERLRAIDAELSTTSLKFGENVLAETHNYQLYITDEKELAGLPEGTIEEAKALAEQEGKNGWIFTLDYPSYIPFMTYADNRELRKELAIAAGKKAFKANEFNNEETYIFT